MGGSCLEIFYINKIGRKGKVIDDSIHIKITRAEKQITIYLLLLIKYKYSITVFNLFNLTLRDENDDTNNINYIVKFNNSIVFFGVRVDSLIEDK